MVQRAGDGSDAPRLAQPEDIAQLQDVEAAADTVFPGSRDPDWPSPASGEERAGAPGFVLVVGDPVVGFVHVLDLGEGRMHLEQLSVRPESARHGLGTALVRAGLAEATKRGATVMTLMTYADIPWNAPFYASLGFVVADPPPGQLAGFLEAEQRLGLARWRRRVAMVRELTDVPELISVNDPVALRALSHPTRLQVLTELALLGRANVAMVADRVAEAPNAVSYHLSVLAKHGLIVPATPPPEATRRERWWRLGSQRGLAFQTDDDTLAGPLTAAFATSRAQLAADWMHRMVRSSEAAEKRGLPSKQATFGVWLTPDEAADAVAHLTSALQPLRDRFFAQRVHGLAEPPAEGMDYYRIDALMFPDLTGAMVSEKGGDGVDQPGPERG